MEDVVTLQDPSGCFVYLSPSVQRLTGFTPKELLGTSASDLVHPDDRPRVEQSSSAALPVGQPWEMEFRCRTRDGPYRWVAARTQVLRDEAGQPFRILRCLRDVTERKEREERDRQARKLEAVGRLAGGMAHDFNNLLTIITGYTGILLDTHRPGDPDHEALTHIHRAAERTALLVRQLLAVAGRQMLTLSVVDLNDVLLHMTEIFKRLLGPSIHLQVNLDPSLQPVQVDRARLEQVLLDLAANARDAMPSGGPFTLTTVNVAAESVGQLATEIPAGPAVRLCVSDGGHGMDERTLAHLFEPFFTTKGVGQGTGLTLAAVHGIIKQCGGHIAVTSRPGEGTTFTITFPAAVPQASEALARAAPASRDRSATILLVEDESAVRALARYVLQAQGYTVLEAGDGEEALEVYAQHAGAIDLLVSDVVMPRRTGPELAQQLTEQASDLPVLFLSGCNRDDADLGQSLGGRQPRFLAKPFRPVELVQLVGEILRVERPSGGRQPPECGTDSAG